MIPPGGPRDEQIEDYVDGRLSPCEAAAVTSYLLAHPAAAAEVEALRRQNEALRRIGEEVLEEPVPERLRDVIRGFARRGRPLAVIGSILLV